LRTERGATFGPPLHFGVTCIASNARCLFLPDEGIDM
jgi:hypothetical protein